MDVEALGMLLPPGWAGIGGDAECGFIHAENQTVADDMAVVVAPRCIVDLADLQLLDVAWDERIHHPFGIRTGNDIFRQWRHVAHGNSGADRRQLLDHVGIGIDDHVPVPAHPQCVLVQRRRTLDKGRTAKGDPGIGHRTQAGREFDIVHSKSPPGRKLDSRGTSKISEGRHIRR